MVHRLLSTPRLTIYLCASTELTKFKELCPAFKGFCAVECQLVSLLSLMPVVLSMFRGHADRNFYSLRAVRGHFLVLHKRN